MHSNKQAGKHIGPHLYQLKPIGFNWNRLKSIYKLYVNTKTPSCQRTHFLKQLKCLNFPSTNHSDNVKPLIRLCQILLKSRGCESIQCETSWGVIIKSSNSGGEPTIAGVLSLFLRCFSLLGSYCSVRVLL